VPCRQRDRSAVDVKSTPHPQVGEGIVGARVIGRPGKRDRRASTTLDGPLMMGDGGRFWTWKVAVVDPERWSGVVVVAVSVTAYLPSRVGTKLYAEPLTGPAKARPSRVTDQLKV